MSMPRRERMAREIADEVRQAGGPFTATGRHHNSAYSLDTLRQLGGKFVEAVMLGEVGQTTVKGLSRHFSVPDAEIRALLEQSDPPGELNFLSKGIVRIQTREIGREITAGDGGRLVFVRTQPTSPITGIRVSYAGGRAFGLTPERRIGTFDSIYATYPSRFEGGREQSINLGGLVPALDRDREDYEEGVPMGHLSPLQFLSLTRPTAAMFRQAGAVDLVVRDELPPEVDASLYIFLQGRYEGFEESVFLSNPTHTVPIVGEEGYQKEARDALGDEIDIVIEAEGVSPYDCGLERRHFFVDSQGRKLGNEAVRQIVAKELLFKLGSPIQTEHRDVVLRLMPGELRAQLKDGSQEGGQALLQVTADGAPRWFMLLNKANGRRAWRGDEDELRRRLECLSEAFALLEAPDSTAGQMRREQYESLEQVDVPMSHASGRQNIWTLAAAVRQGDLPDAPLGAFLA